MQCTKNIGLIFPVLTQIRQGDPFFMTLVSELTQALFQASYSTTVVSAKTLEELRQIVCEMYQNKQVDAFILMYSIKDDPVLSFLVDNHIPFVMLGTPVDIQERIVFVDNDNLSIGQTATRYLLEQGHQDIIFVGGSQEEWVYQERYNGYYLEMMNAHLVGECYDITKVESTSKLCQRLEDAPPTAMVVASDMLAVKMVPFLEKFGCYVGGNFGLVSVNNSMFTTLTHPYLTSIDIHIKTLASQSARLIVEVLNKDNLPLTRYVIPHELVVRESTPKFWSDPSFFLTNK